MRCYGIAYSELENIFSEKLECMYDVIISALTSKRFQEYYHGWVVGMESSSPHLVVQLCNVLSKTISSFVILNECNFHL